MSEVTKIEDFIRQSVKGRESVLEVAKEMLDGKEASVIKLSQPVIEPVRAESPAVSHIFNHVGPFITYLQKYGCEDTVILANVYVCGGSIVACLNERADKGRESISMVPSIHPLFAPWYSKLTEDPCLSMRCAAEFFTEHHRTIAQPDSRELRMTFNQIKVSKQTTIQAGQGVQSLNGIMVETLIQGVKQTEPMELPETITIRTPIYLGTPVIDIEIDLSVYEDDGVVFCKFTSSDFAVKQLEVFEAMLAEVQRELGSTAVCGAGRLLYQDWKYIKP